MYKEAFRMSFEYLDKLNKNQREAATTIYGNLLILAGAGSGKTATLIARTAYMIDSGINPENILLLTFTNKAAEEMKNRIIRDIGETAEKVTACTFHSFCSNFLRKYSHLVNIDSGFTIMDGPDSIEAMSMAKEEYFYKKDVPEDFPSKKTIFSIYSNAINGDVSYGDIIEKCKLEAFEKDIVQIIINYEDYKTEHNLMDYDDLLYHTYHILKNHEDIRYKYDKQYEYISIDEFQDTNVLQDKVLELLNRNSMNLAAVGDDNQSIYKFRGAEVENILTFHKRYPGCKIITLDENYRSSQEILDFCNSMMAHSIEGSKKMLKGQFKGDSPALIITDNNHDEENFILNKIKAFMKAGVPLEEIAVIVRNANQSFGLEMKLNSAGIPYKKFGGIKFLEKEAVKDILAFLRLSVNSKDELALYRILQKYPGIGKGYAKKICEKVSQDGIEALNDIYKKTKFHIYLEELYKIQEKISSLTLSEQLKYIIDDYYPGVIKRSIDCSSMKDKDEKRRAIKEQIGESRALLDMCSKYHSTKKFLEDLVLDASRIEEKDGTLNITTIHSAKGLEYDVVFIMDTVDGIFPRTQEKNPEDAEELRCMYVAATRARKYLYLMSPRYIDQRYRSLQVPLSHFLNYNDVLETVKCNDSYNLKKMRHVSWPFF